MIFKLKRCFIILVFFISSLILASCDYYVDSTEDGFIDYESIESTVKDAVLPGIVIVNDFVFGIIVNKSGSSYIVISGYNSVGNSSSHRIKDYNGVEYSAELIKSSESVFLSMYRFTSTSSDIKVLQLSHSKPEKNNGIMTIGSNNAVKFGSAYEESFNNSLNTVLFSHTAQSTTLNGSSIVFDHSGVVVGIEVGSSILSTNGRTTRYAVHAGRIRDFL